VLFSLEYKDQALRDDIKKYEVDQILPDRVVDPQLLDNLLTLSNSKEFVDCLADKEDSIVGERGVRLSGGQKQRISIARSLSHSPKILILDEATSALDAQSEHLVNKALTEIMENKNKTTIVIAHRLSTVKSADLVMMLKDGEVLEIGTHDQLYAKNGEYSKLIEKQMQKDLKEEGEDNRETNEKNRDIAQEKDTRSDKN